MTKVYEIPLEASPQVFTIPLGVTEYQLRLSWCDPSACWLLDIALGDDQAPVVSGLPVITGTDILGQFAYLGIGGRLVAQTVGDEQAVPTFTNLGQTGKLFFLVD